MKHPQVRIFPHSVEKEFPSEESLKEWLLGDLRQELRGVYRLRTASCVKDLPPGSIVLFRYGQGIVGEGVVWKGKELLNPRAKEKTKTGEEAEYAAQVTFAPSSIRLYVPPLSVGLIQDHMKEHHFGKNIVKYAGAYAELDWKIYACILKEVVSRGTFENRGKQKHENSTKTA
jgi:hypothetical protein